MSDKTARTHNHVSNRARNKNGGERKIVFKGVLDSPFRIQWPVVTSSMQKDVLDATVALLSGVADYHISRKRKRTSAQQKESRKKRKQVEADADRPTAVLSETSAMEIDNVLPDSNLATLERPPVSKHLIVGINEVTKRLEQQIRAERVTRMSLHSSTNDPPSCLLHIVLVCRSDINPSILVDHLPHLVAAFNSLRPEQLIRLIPLQTGAETRLSQVVGLRRAAVLALDSGCPNLDSILELVKDLPTLSASWLASSIAVENFVPTHIKQVRTSAPKDMKAEKKRRKEEKVSKKEKRRSTSNQVSKGR